MRPLFLWIHSMRNGHLTIPLIASTIIFLLAVFAYWPGLHGAFLFDDFANLPSLGSTGPIHDGSSFWRYITSGTADPTGRPLTLSTFLLDARNWPADPAPFKRTNLILHLINGALLALLLCRLGSQVFEKADFLRINLAGVVGAGLWLLHPLFVSTTLYIVQREAMLPASFTLLGLLAWLRGRKSMRRGHEFRGATWVALGLGGCTVLAVLSKANGILLPALALVLEHVLLRYDEERETAWPSQRAYRLLMLVFAWLPATIVAAYLLQQGWSGLVHGISSARSWTLGQRLLTEPRVLFDYLDLLWLPRPFTPGLFNDHIQVSTSLWFPVTTLPALVGVLGLIVGAWLLKRRAPAVALAILFYFVGQSLESSTVALELYFEHRNYLPAMLMFWPLALGLCDVRFQPASKPTGTRMATQAVSSEVDLIGKPARSASKNAKLALAALILLGMALMTRGGASLWGSSHDQALLWARLNPGSARAQAYAAQAELDDNQPALAARRLIGPLSKAPDQVQLALNLFGAQCQLGRIPPSTLAASRTALRTTRDPGTLLVSWFERAIDQIAHPPCPQLNLATLSSLLQSALANPYLASNPGRQQDIHYLQGRIQLARGDADAALVEFNRALDLQVRTPMALKQAALLGSSGFPRQGLAHLDHLEAEPKTDNTSPPGMPRVHDWVLQRQRYWPKELSRLRATLREDAMNQDHAIK